MVKKKTEEQALVPAVSNLPGFLRDKGKGRGQEKVDQTDLIMPRVKLLQQLSGEVVDETFTAGHLINSLIKEDYGTEIVFIPIKHYKSRIYWRERDAGGGMLCNSLDASLPSSGEYAKSCGACEKCKWPKEKGESPDCTLYYNFVIIINGTVIPVVLPMEKSKIPIARALITLTKYVGGNLDIFAKKYKIVSKVEKKKGGTFFNYTVAPVGFVTEEEFQLAESVFIQLQDKSISVEQDNIEG